MASKAGGASTARGSATVSEPRYCLKGSQAGGFAAGEFGVRMVCNKCGARRRIPAREYIRLSDTKFNCQTMSSIIPPTAAKCLPLVPEEPKTDAERRKPFQPEGMLDGRT